MNTGRRPAAGAFFIMAAALAAAAAGATSLRHLDLQDLTIESSDIVVGTVAGSRSYWNDSHTKILTDVEVDVSQSLKGTRAGHLTLTELGGEVDGARYTVPGCPAFRRGEEAVLFVWRDTRGRAQVNGLAQGKFDIARDAKTGQRTVQRPIPGFEVSNLRTLSAPLPGETAPPLSLDDFLREIGRTLAAPDSRHGH